jgi:hypothetical protein
MLCGSHFRTFSPISQVEQWPQAKRAAIYRVKYSYGYGTPKNPLDFSFTRTDFWSTMVYTMYNGIFHRVNGP